MQLISPLIFVWNGPGYILLSPIFLHSLMNLWFLSKSLRIFISTDLILWLYVWDGWLEETDRERGHWGHEMVDQGRWRGEEKLKIWDDWSKEAKRDGGEVEVYSWNTKQKSRSMITNILAYKLLNYKTINTTTTLQKDRNQLAKSVTKIYTLMEKRKRPTSHLSIPMY